ncbi:hypothetical protein SDJN03_18339, partial [Cucurbita argyrosperma subsp. sororia]
MVSLFETQNQILLSLSNSGGIFLSLALSLSGDFDYLEWLLLLLSLNPRRGRTSRLMLGTLTRPICVI